MSGPGDFSCGLDRFTALHSGVESGFFGLDARGWAGLFLRAGSCFGSIEECADRGVADTVFVDEDEEGEGGGADEDEFGEVVDVPVGGPDLEAHDEGEVGEVEPVGGVGEVADAGVFAGEKLAEEAGEAEEHEPGVGGGEEGGEQVTCGVGFAGFEEMKSGEEGGQGEGEPEQPFLAGAFFEFGSGVAERAEEEEDGVVDQGWRPGEDTSGGIDAEGLGHEQLGQERERDEPKEAVGGLDEPAWGSEFEFAGDEVRDEVEGDEPEEVVEEPEMVEDGDEGGGEDDFRELERVGGGGIGWVEGGGVGGGSEWGEVGGDLLATCGEVRIGGGVVDGGADGVDDGHVEAGGIEGCLVEPVAGIGIAAQVDEALGGFELTEESG